MERPQTEAIGVIGQEERSERDAIVRLNVDVTE